MNYFPPELIFDMESFCLFKNIIRKLVNRMKTSLFSPNLIFTIISFRLSTKFLKIKVK